MGRCHELPPGAIDLDTHSAPSFCDRLLDDVRLAAPARAAGMRAVRCKAHEQDTTVRAALGRRAVPGIEAFGGSHFGSRMKGNTRRLGRRRG